MLTPMCQHYVLKINIICHKFSLKNSYTVIFDIFVLQNVVKSYFCILIDLWYPIGQGCNEHIFLGYHHGIGVLVHTGWEPSSQMGFLWLVTVHSLHTLVVDILHNCLYYYLSFSWHLRWNQNTNFREKKFYLEQY